MKKFVTMIACLAITGGAFAKGVDIPKFSLGAKAGLNVSNFSSRGGNSLIPQIGFHIGIAGEIKASRIFAVAPEIVFSTQGAKEKVENTKITMASNYLNIPVMARFYVIDALSLEVGPQFGFAVGMNAKVKDGNREFEHKLKSGDDYNVFDFMVGLGLTYNYKHKFITSVRWNYGLTDVLKGNDIPSNKNSLFQLSVGYNFL